MSVIIPCAIAEALMKSPDIHLLTSRKGAIENWGFLNGTQILRNYNTYDGGCLHCLELN